MNATILKTTFFHKMKLDLTGNGKSHFTTILENYTWIIHLSTDFDNHLCEC